ncbi:glycosyltransferase [Bacillus weihaiensis]|uniref:glycosyltransferase n=1 Tax=Bacillus weihaiensis TaxID=1547283 RepID=UPI0023577173|nr:glycosyltransferase [Bacillus weihaiensis]
MELPISIVIAVADDTRISKCLDSIDEECEVVVVANGATKEVVDILSTYSEKMKLKLIELDVRNLSKSRDVGIKAASYNNIILMDSDCVFLKGTIKRFYELIEIKGHKIVNGFIEFKATTVGSKLVKNSRDYLNSISNTGYAFAPCLGLKKDLVNEIGGYYFDHSIKWVEDAELNVRLKKNKILIFDAPEAIIEHCSIPLKKDLRAAFNYGTGKRIGVRKGIMRGVGAFWSDIPKIFIKKGLFTSIYMICWNICYTFGYYLQPILKNEEGNKDEKSNMFK